MIPLLQEQLPQEMVSMVEVMKLDIHPSEQDVLTATLAKLQEQEAKTAGEKVDRLMQQYRSRGLAVVGLQETLEALANGQVEELLIIGALEASHPQPEEVQAILAPEIRDSKGGTESEEPRQASMPDLLVTKAKQTGANRCHQRQIPPAQPIGEIVEGDPIFDRNRDYGPIFCQMLECIISETGFCRKSA